MLLLPLFVGFYFLHMISLKPIHVGSPNLPPRVVEPINFGVKTQVHEAHKTVQALVFALL